MNRLILSFVFIFVGVLHSYSNEFLIKLSNKIYQNECSSKEDNLLFWNKNESFPSLGIGHFIWYPQNCPATFEETFPALVSFLKNQNVPLPKWLDEKMSCPWATREIFYHQIHSEKMQELKKLLIATKKQQSLFIIKRFEDSLRQIVAKLPSNKKQAVLNQVKQLMANPKSMFALIDYLHFKGTGLNEKERYKNQGWGLLQVLSKMPDTSSDALQEFVRCAKDLLIQRVNNSPSPSTEKKWLDGWINRIQRYL